MDLSSTRRERRLKLRYEGVAVSAGNLLYTPIKITHFEIVDSCLNPGKRMLMAQTRYIDKQTGEVAIRPLMTESYQLIHDIEGTEDSLPHYTKIRRAKDGMLLWTTLNQEEKQILFTL